MLHLTTCLLALPILGTSHLDAPVVLATEARKPSAVLKDIAVHNSFARMMAHGVALDFEYPGFRK